MRVGLLADSCGDIERLDKALTLLVGPLGCGSIFFLGGAYADIDTVMRERSGGEGEAYSDQDFLDDVARFLAAGQSAPANSGKALAAEDLIGAAVVRVPERDSPEYDDDTIPNKVFEMLEGFIILLISYKGDLTKEEIANATVILHGGGKKPSAVQIGARAFICPGPLHPSGGVAVLDADGKQLSFEVYDLEGNKQRSESLKVGGSSKMTVK